MERFREEDRERMGATPPSVATAAASAGGLKGSEKPFTTRTFFCRQSMRRMALMACLTVLQVACSKVRVVQDVNIQTDAVSRAAGIEPAADGGYFLFVNNLTGTITKLDRHGKQQWMVREGNTPGAEIEFAMATPLSHGRLLVCGKRIPFAPALNELPGFMLVLDSSGRELMRFDPLRNKSNGIGLFNFEQCGPWGLGFVALMSALDASKSAESNRPGTEWCKPVLVKFDENLQELWRVPSPIGDLSPMAVHVPPKSCANGNLIISGLMAIALVDDHGRELKRLEDSGPGAGATVVRELLPRPGLRLVKRKADHSVWIPYEDYDENLKLVASRKLKFDHLIGLPFGTLLEDGRLAVLGGAPEIHEPSAVAFYSHSGDALGEYELPFGHDEPPTVVWRTKPLGAATFRSALNFGRYQIKFSQLSFPSGVGGHN